MNSIKKSGSTVPVSSAALLFAFVQSLNIVALLMLLGWLSNTNPLASIGKLYFIIAFVVLMSLNLIIVNNKKRYEEMISSFEDKPEYIHKKNWIITLTYMIISFLIVLILPVFTK